MTVKELFELWNNTYGLNPWPSTYKVDAITYVNVFHFIVTNRMRLGDYTPMATYNLIEIVFSKNGNLMFKNVELIVEE